MPIEENTYKFFREIFCDYLKIKNRDPLDEIINAKYQDLDIIDPDMLKKEEIDKKITLTERFVNLFKSEKKPLTEEEKEEEKRNDILKKLDEKILNLAKQFNTPNILPVDQITKDTTLLDKNFELIINTRKIGNNADNEDLDIYKSYLDILFNIDEKILEPFGFYIANSLFEKNNYKKIRDYEKYIIICAINSRFIALYNKQILLKQLEELLRDITKTLYKCYNRTTSSAVDIKSSTVNIKNKVTTSIGDKYRGIKDRFSRKDVDKGIEPPVINELNLNTVSNKENKIGGNNQVGGLLYLNTDPEMKKIEGMIIMLNNLFQSGDLTVESLTQEYNATSSSKVSWLVDILFASGIVLSGGLLGVFASSASSLALTIGNASLCGITGGVWTFSREAILKSYHFSIDLDDTLTELKKQFDLHYNDLDENKKIRDCPAVRESKLKPVYKDIESKIKQFSDTVMVSYQKYLDIFEFIVKSRKNILGNKICDVPETIVLSENDEEFKEIWQPVLQDIYNKWPAGNKNSAKMIRTYTDTKETEFNNFFKALGIDTKCSKPSARRTLQDAIDDIKKKNGRDLVISLKTRFLCNDTPQGQSSVTSTTASDLSAASSNPTTSTTSNSSGGGKTRRLKKRKTQKHSRKGKTYKHK